MRVYNDDKYNLIWVDYLTPDTPKEKSGVLSYIKSKFFKKNTTHHPTLESQIAKLNTWQSKPNGQPISKFILNDKPIKLGDFLLDKAKAPAESKYIPTSNYQYFAYADEDCTKLVGTILISHSDNSEYPNNFEYIVVDPKHTHLGYGTAMTQSVLENLPFFTNSPDAKNIAVYARNNNSNALKTLKKTGFELYTPNYDEEELINSSYTAMVYTHKDNTKNSNTSSDYLLHDKENDIIWDIIPSYSKMGAKEKDYTTRLNKYAEDLNTWNDDKILHFITTEKLGDHICETLNEEFVPNTACFALNKKGQPMAIIVLSPPYEQDINLEYIIVNEKYRNQHLATRLLKSLKSNLSTIIHTDSVENMGALVRRDNIASASALKNAGFTNLRPAHDKDSLFKVYFCRIQKPTKLSDNLDSHTL